MNKRLANIIAYAFHPLLMATFLIVVLYFCAPTLLRPINSATILPVITAVFVLTFCIPILSVGLLKITKSISSIKLENRNERIMPLFFIAVYYGLTTYLFAYKLRLGDIFVVMFGATSVVILIVAVISFKYKISAHAAGVWGVVGFLTAIHFKFIDGALLWPIIGCVLLAGLISSSRLALNAHSSNEVHTGAILGFLISFCSIFFLI